MYKVGMIGGSYNPLHNGHVRAIKKALTVVDELHIIIGNIPNMDDVSIQTKLKWFKILFKDYGNRIVLHTLYDDRHDKSEYTLDKWVKDSTRIKSMIGKHIDVVFCGSDYNRPDNPYKVCYKEQRIVYVDRSDGISSTDFKKDIKAHKDWVPDIVYQTYMRKFKSGVR